MLDDRGDLVPLSNDPAVSVGRRNDRRQHRRGRLPALVQVHESGQRLCAEQRHVARQQNQRAARIPQQRLGLQQGMAGAELRFLHRKGKARPVRECALQLVRLVADDDDDRCRGQGRSSQEGVLDKRTTGCGMQDFWHRRLHPGALPGREDDDVDVRHGRPLV